MAEGLQLSVGPLIQGYVSAAEPFPLAIDVANEGELARGHIEITMQGGSIQQPVELPRGASKRVVLYPSVGYAYYEGLEVVLQTNRGRVRSKFEVNDYFQGQFVLEIGDFAGDLGFIDVARQEKEELEESIRTAYVKPEDAPDRLVGYVPSCAVILGDGSERLSDAQIRALKLYALRGGMLLFIGGASAPLLRDPRWQEVLPVQGFTPRTLSSSQVLTLYGAEPLEQPVTVAAGKLVPGAVAEWEGDVPLYAIKQLGRGKVALLAVDPFEAPLSQWDGREALFRRILPKVQALPEEAHYPPGAGAIYPPEPVRSSDRVDPFNAQLPPVSTVLTILVGYFLMVVPINFLVLRKMRRSELAWVSAPLLSLGFASLLFLLAGNLYSAKTSLFTNGALMLQQGLDEGVFSGESSMFFARGGSYNLRLQGVDIGRYR